MSAQLLETPATQGVPTRRPFLRIVRTPKRKARALPFVVLVVVLLGGALVGLLVLNTQRAQLSFRAAALQAEVDGLQDQQQQLQREVESDQDPATLASRAAALGMVPETQPGFVNGNGSVIGAVPSGAPVPAAGAKAQGGVIVASPSTAPSAKTSSGSTSQAATTKTTPSSKAPTSTTTNAPKTSSSKAPTATPSSRSSR